MVDELTLYVDITKIAEDYFGPAAPRLISRIATSRLNKDPKYITGKDLPELITWIKLTLAMITEETETINEFVFRLNELSYSW